MTEVREFNNPLVALHHARPLQGSTTKVMKKNITKSRMDKRIENKSSSVRRQVAVAREMQRDIDRSKGKTVTQSKKGPKTRKELVAKVRGGLCPGSDLDLWSKILSNPWKYEGIFCPVSYNPAPSFIQSTCRTTSTNLNAGTAANTTSTYVFYPGHYLSADGAAGADFDAVSYHSRDIAVGAAGTRYVVGPMIKTDGGGPRTPIIGTVRTGTNLGVTDLGLATANASALGWDVALPYTSDSIHGSGHHSRWQLVAMGIKFRQITPELTRAGTFVTVQPNNSFTHTPVTFDISEFQKFPTFKDHGPEGFAISWIPRAQDLAFWHGSEDNTSAGSYNFAYGGAIYVFVSNSSASTINFSYEVTCHWQLAGDYLNTVGRPGAHSPESKPAVEKAISVMQNGHPTADQAPALMGKASDHDGAKSSATWYDTAMNLYKGANKVAARVAPLLS